MPKNILIVSARFYPELSKELEENTSSALKADGHNVTTLHCTGALEIPQIINAHKNNFDGFLALGIVIRGATTHYDVVVNESARALTNLSLKHNIAIINSILPCENKEQAQARISSTAKDKGGYGAKALINLIDNINFIN